MVTYFHHAQEMREDNLRVLLPRTLYVSPINENQVLLLICPVGNLEQVQFDESRYLFPVFSVVSSLKYNNFDSLPKVRPFSVEHSLLFQDMKKKLSRI